MPPIRHAVLFAEGLAAEGPGAAAEALERIAGLRILTRVALALGKAGVEQLLVVVGDDSDPVRAALAADDRRLSRAGVSTTIASPADALARVEELDARQPGPWLLAGADHIFAPQTVSALADAAGSDDHAWAGVAVGAQEPTGVQHSLRVELDGDRVRALGPALASHDALACGLWVVATSTLRGLLEPGAAGSVAAGLIRLVEQGRVRAVDVGDRFWRKVANRSERAAAQRHMMSTLSKPTDGPILRNISRRISRRITAVLVHTPMTPNQMTVLSTTVGLIGIAMVFQVSWGWVALGAVLVELQTALDCCDGELARLKFQGSRFGEWLDTLSDDLVNTGFALALGWAAKEHTGEPIYWYLTLAGMAGYLIYDAVLYSQLARVHKSGTGFSFRWWFQSEDTYVKQSLAKGNRASRLLAGFHNLTRREFFIMGFMIFALARVPQLASFWYVTLGAGHATLSVLHLLAGGVRGRQQSAG